jgi:TPP-dependent pyruvate/acetoin dehydrogenase alpha subunit
MDSEVRARIDEAAAFAAASPLPRPETATSDVFAAPHAKGA